MEEVGEGREDKSNPHLSLWLVLLSVLCLCFCSSLCRAPGCTRRNNRGGQKYQPFSCTCWTLLRWAHADYVCAVFKKQFPAAGYPWWCSLWSINDVDEWIRSAKKPVDGSHGALLKRHTDIRLNCWANWTCFLAVAPIYVHSVAVSPSSLLKWPLVRSSHSVAVSKGGRGEHRG